MGRHEGLPKAHTTVISKIDLLEKLEFIDRHETNRKRVLAIETKFRQMIDAHVASLPSTSDLFGDFNTSPFVLLIHSRERSYSKISDLERDILPAKQFSSMETSAGRMVEEVVLPVYGWECVPSGMHTTYSAIDGRKRDEDVLHLVTLKSGPRCLNDEMSENFADAILRNYKEWASDAGVSRIDFTYGTLYGTHKVSNKKDWHILRNIKEKNPRGVVVDPADRWECAFKDRTTRVDVTIRVGLDWWQLLGGETCFIEVMFALIRACITPGSMDDASLQYRIRDLGRIVSMKQIPESYNVSLLQKSQLPWLFLIAKHYCDFLSE